ncbi:MAG: succinate dehydrogenase, cytochrome b556 subunit [Pseudomonadales bacterium]
MNKSSRPVYLNPFQFLPLAAIASITHRVTGVVLFAAMALFLYLVDTALESDAGFAEVTEFVGGPTIKLLTWAALAALIYHLIAGVRHLLLDFHIGDTLQGGRRTSQATFVVSAVLIVLTGLWIW